MLILYSNIYCILFIYCSNSLRAGRSGIESRWGRDFLHPFRPAQEPTQPPIQWIPCLSRG